MPKTDIKRPASEDVAELADEALDRATNTQACLTYVICHGPCSSPAE
ncbi:MAG: hypothetical protein ISR48_03110 [Alphaproteobacteria bacterium]|nr:hypothetical protein [Alphaproteobacteria bacterium]